MSLLWQMDPHQYHSKDDLHTTTQNLADEPTLPNGTPTSTRADMTCIPLHLTWQMNLLWPMESCPRYQSRDDLHTTTQNLADELTLADEAPTQYQSRDDLHTITQNMAGEPTLANGTPTSTRADMTLHTTTQNLAETPTLVNGTPTSTRAEMTCIPLHKTWQMKLIWLMDTSGPRAEMSYIPLHQNLADEPTLANRLPTSTRAEMTCIPLHKTWQMNLLWPMDSPGTRAEMTCIPLHLNLADEPTLANGPPTSTRADMTCIPLYKTWQMNLIWLMNIHPVPDQRWLAYQFTKLGRNIYVGQWTSH